MKSELISIIMPVYNPGTFLIPCLESILEQTYTQWELIAVNDGSDDGSFQTLKKYSELDSRISVYQNEGKGIINALSLAFNHTSGDIITRMDSDDLMPKSKLHILYNQLINHGAGHISTGKVEYFATGKTLMEGYVAYASWLNDLIDQDVHWQNTYKECVIASPNWMMYKSDILNIGGICSGIYPEDYELIFRCYHAGFPVIGSTEITHLWRDHDLRTSRTSDDYKDNRFLELKISQFLIDKKFANSEFTVWGAGTKGKIVANDLIERKIQFNWVTNNSKKIGVNIYGKILTNPFDGLYPEGSVALIATTQDQIMIERFCELKGIRPVWLC